MASITSFFWYFLKIFLTDFFYALSPSKVIPPLVAPIITVIVILLYRPTHETNTDFNFHQKFRNLPKVCKILRVRSSGCRGVRAPWNTAPDLVRVNFPSPPNGGQGHRKNKDRARGNSYQRSMSVLIPQECKSKIDMAFMTTPDKPRLPQTVWLLLIP